LPLTDERLREIVVELLARPGHNKAEALVHEALVHGLGVPSTEVVFEHTMREVRGRADALLGRTILEFKSDLRRELSDAEEQLKRYLSQREQETGDKCVGIATDGAEFRPYELRRGGLVALSPFKPPRDRPKYLLYWLGSIVRTSPELRPDPETVRQQFGRESLAYEVARSRLELLWESAKDHEEVKLKRRLWADLLSIVYGTQVDDDSLFFQHTYLTIVAKTMATLALGVELPAPVDLLAGKAFHDRGIDGVVESDFFDWVHAAPAANDLVRRIAAQVARFRLGDINHDVLKGLYESLIDPEQRHYLGEYYTPDWLAQWVCERAIDRPLEQRVLDPACGSGTFLFHAVRRFLQAADAAGTPNQEALARCTGRIFGIDVHPVAVINARVTYLLAIGEERLRDRQAALNIPVYLGDSLQWNTEQFIAKREVRIDVPNGPPLTFPYVVAQDLSLFDSVIGEMLRRSEGREKAEGFENWLKRRKKIEDDGLRRALVRTYENLRKLREAGRNHIWGYVARNLTRPVWLSSADQRFEVVIGNPPWLPYHDTSREMQRRFREECVQRGLWAGGKVATHQDESAYFFARSVELYLRPGGTIAFVMPYATMSRQQYRGFRTGRFVSKEGQLHSSVAFTEAWTFDETVQPLFNVPSCVLFAREGGARKDSAPLPKGVTAYSGHLPERDAPAEKAASCLTSKVVPWPDGGEKVPSAYAKLFRQGATVVPRVLWVVELAPSGRLGANPAAPLVQSRRTSLEKKPWKDSDPLRGPIEAEFLRPLYLGESIAPFRALGPALAVIPWDEQGEKLLVAKAAREAGYSHLAQWLGAAERLWGGLGRDRSVADEAKRMTLLQRIDKFHGLSAQMPPKPLRVLYSASGTLPAAAVLRDARAVAEHKLYWAATEDAREARYLVAVLNSEALRARVAPRQSRGQWGARDFDKLLAEAIPLFDPNSARHEGLAELAVRAEKVAGQVMLPEGVHFIRARQMIRTALGEDGVATRIEALVTELLRARSG
jgi:hypothetical protein